MISRAACVDANLNYLTEFFLQVFSQFTGVRDRPNKIMSDQGSQLADALKELQDIIECINWNLSNIFSIKYNTEWSFAPANTLNIYI